MDHSDDNMFDQDYDKTLENDYNVSNLPSVQHFNQLKDICNNFVTELNDSKSFDIKSIWDIASPNESIRLDIEPIENLPGAMDIISSNNTFLNKVMQAFTILGAEIYNLIGDRDYSSLQFLILYGESLDENEKIEEGDSEVQISRILPELVKLYEKVKKLIPLALNISNQMLALYNKKFINFQNSFKNLSFYKPFEYLSQIMSFLNTIDCIYNENENLRNHWKLYKLMIHKTKSDSLSFGYTENQSTKLQKYVRLLENSVLSGKLLQSLISHLLNSTLDQDMSKQTKDTTISNIEYCNHLGNYIKVKGEKLINDIGGLTETNQKLQFYDLISLLSYYNKIFEIEIKNSTIASVDRDVFKVTWNVFKKITQIPIVGHINFNTGDYFKTMVNFTKKFDFSSIDSLNKSQLTLITNNFDSLILNLKLQVVTWITRTNSTIFDPIIKDNLGQYNDSRIRLLINGVLLSYQIKNNLIYCLNLHLNLGVELKGSLLQSACLAMELLKVIENQFFKF